MYLNQIIYYSLNPKRRAILQIFYYTLESQQMSERIRTNQSFPYKQEQDLQDLMTPEKGIEPQSFDYYSTLLFLDSPEFEQPMRIYQEFNFEAGSMSSERQIEESFDIEEITPLNLISQESNGISLQTQQPASNPNRRSKKKNSKKNTKNFLINFRNFFTDYIKQKYPQARKDKFLISFESKKGVNKTDYEELFKIKEYQGILQAMFQEKYLNRQFQLSRSKQNVRAIYLKKIAVLEKAFKQKYFPRLN